jgi:cell division protein FtsW (lipid II flippase)
MLLNNISKTEAAVLIFIFILLLTGLGLVFINVPLFEQYIGEDALVEWITVIALLMACLTCFIRAIKLQRHRTWLFLLTSVLLGLVLFFGAGEEISWGQRILGIESSEYFKEKNLQGETNFHNLVLGGIKINMWIFSFLLTAVLGVYLLLIPFLYRKKKWMQTFVRNWGIPLPKLYQVIAFVMLFITEFIPHGKRAELLEAGTALMLFLIIRFPANPQSFEASKN